MTSFANKLSNKTDESTTITYKCDKCGKCKNKFFIHLDMDGDNKYIQLENNWNLNKYFMKSTPSTFISCQQMCNTSNECNGFVLM